MFTYTKKIRAEKFKTIFNTKIIQMIKIVHI